MLTVTDQMKKVGVATFQGARNIASYVPTKLRAFIYSLLATAFLLEGIWDLVPEALEGKALKSAAVLGFTMAALNTNDLP
jgi:hypothetical protein